MSREDLRHVTVKVGGRDIGTFQTKTGGNADSDEVKNRPGGVPGQESLGGPPMVENVTVSRVYKIARDRPLLNFLLSSRGKADMEIIDQGLDADYNAFQAPIVYKGTLKSVNNPDANSNSNDPASLELEQTTVEVIAA